MSPPTWQTYRSEWRRPPRAHLIQLVTGGRQAPSDFGRRRFEALGDLLGIIGGLIVGVFQLGVTASFYTNQVLDALTTAGLVEFTP